MSNLEQGDKWAVFGASGFVGRGVVSELDRRFGNPRQYPAWRVTCRPDTTPSSLLEMAQAEEGLEALIDQLSGVEVVINAAGLASPDAPRSPALTGANAYWPQLLTEAARKAGVKRLIHLSSAAVQGRTAVLDESRSTRPFSPYSESKALGELALLQYRDSADSGRTEVVIVRATSVQGEGRTTSGGLQRIARSPLASVAAPGNQASAVSSLASLSELVVAIGLHEEETPEIVLQPWEGASVRDVLRLAGARREPITLPRWLCYLATSSVSAAGRVVPKLAGLGRRLEMMWQGQDQILGWAAENKLVTLPTQGPSRHLRKALMGEDAR